MIVQQSEGLRVWKEYFQELLNGEEIENNEHAETTEIYQNVQPKVEPPSLQELSKAIQELKSNKAPGQDSICAEVLKAGGEVLVMRLHKLILEIWEKEEMPDDWKEAIVIPVFKKGNKHDCNNYRGISLLSTPYKVLSKIILKRIETYTEAIIEEHQAGFVKGRSTTDQILIVKEAIAKYWEYNKECFLLFVDFQKAYDSLFRPKIWQQMRKFGIPEKLIRLTKMTVEGSRCKVRVNGEVTPSFEVNSGVRQGDGLSPIIFNIALEQALEEVNKLDKGIHIGKKINILAFADDIVIITETIEDLKLLTKVLLEETSKVGLKINETKTKAIHLKRNKHDDFRELKVENYTFERISTFKYLGTTLSEENLEDMEIQIRLVNANKSMHACKKLLSSKLLSHCSKKKTLQNDNKTCIDVWLRKLDSDKKNRKEISNF
ncbi:hypothetical protein M8J77_012165 [Diaphorina citri]|nr:hypothetical protein M8J77_012165 [Diaphorina citri]